MDAILKTSQEELFLQSGHYLVLHFSQGYACFRVTDVEWANLEPWPLGAVAALSNLTDYDQVQDANANHYLEPLDNLLIYHTFWGVTPATARIYVQYPGRADLGSILSTPRTITGDIGYIDGHKSPFWGPMSRATEVISVKDKYPQFQVYNPTGDDYVNVMMNFDQRHYRYQIIRDPGLIKDLISGKQARKLYTMGGAWPNPMDVPQWLRTDLDKITVTDPVTRRATQVDYMNYTMSVVGG